MLNLIVISLCLLIGISLTYFAIYKIKPESFKISASLKWASFVLEVKIPSMTDRKTRKDRDLE